jgi:hypothetical protein
LPPPQPQPAAPPQPQPLVQPPPPAQPPPPVGPSPSLVTPPAQVQDIQPVSPFRHFLLRIGEVGLVAIIFVAYLIWNWRDTVNWFHSFLSALKPNF